MKYFYHHPLHSNQIVFSQYLALKLNNKCHFYLYILKKFAFDKKLEYLNIYRMLK